MQVLHGMAGHVAGHQVRGELDTCELSTKTAREGSYQQGFAQARNTFEQYVATGDQRREHIIDHLLLADDRLAQFDAQGLGQLAGALNRVCGWKFAHRAFLRVCRLATWRLKSALESRFAGSGPRAWLMTREGWRVRRSRT